MQISNECKSEIAKLSRLLNPDSELNNQDTEPTPLELWIELFTLFDQQPQSTQLDILGHTPPNVISNIHLNIEKAKTEAQMRYIKDGLTLLRNAGLNIKMGVDEAATALLKNINGDVFSALSNQANINNFEEEKPKPAKLITSARYKNSSDAFKKGEHEFVTESGRTFFSPTVLAEIESLRSNGVSFSKARAIIHQAFGVLITNGVFYNKKR